MSIEISVMDTDPQTAADIANDIAAYIDSAFYEIQHERALEAFHIVEKEYLESQNEIESINDSLQIIRNFGILDYESQVTSLSEAYANAVVQGNESAAEEINRQMRILSRYGGIYIELTGKLENEIERSGQLKEKYVAYKINIDHFLDKLFGSFDKDAIIGSLKRLDKNNIIAPLSQKILTHEIIRKIPNFGYKMAESYNPDTADFE